VKLVAQHCRHVEIGQKLPHILEPCSGCSKEGELGVIQVKRVSIHPYIHEEQLISHEERKRGGVLESPCTLEELEF
jgi:hypothetical protein